MGSSCAEPPTRTSSAASIGLAASAAGISSPSVSAKDLLGTSALTADSALPNKPDLRASAASATFCAVSAAIAISLPSLASAAFSDLSAAAESPAAADASWSDWSDVALALSVASDAWTEDSCVACADASFAASPASSTPASAWPELESDLTVPVSEATEVVCEAASCVAACSACCSLACSASAALAAAALRARGSPPCLTTSASTIASAA